MLEEAIYKFRTTGPMLLPEVIDNFWLGDIKMYEDYAILPYEVHNPQSLDRIIEMFDIVSIKGIKPTGSTQPYCSIFFFIDAVYSRGQTVLVRYFGVYVLFTGLEVQCRKNDVKTQCDPFHFLSILTKQR